MRLYCAGFCPICWTVIAAAFCVTAIKDGNSLHLVLIALCCVLIAKKVIQKIRDKAK